MDNNELIQQARELCEKATPGPWYNFGDWMIHTEPDIEHNGIHNEKTIGTVRANNAAFIAASSFLVPQLCDALEAMTARAEKAEAENRWIPVWERLPEKPYGCLVIVEQDDYWGEPREVMYPHFVGYDGEQWNDGDGEKISLEATHWRPLPEPPKGE